MDLFLMSTYRRCPLRGGGKQTTVHFDAKLYKSFRHKSNLCKKNVNLIWLACKLKWIPYDLYLPEVSFTRKLLKLVLNQLMGKCSKMTCIEKLYLETMNNLQCNQSFDYIWTPKVLYEKNAFELSWLYRWSQHVVVMANH